MMGWEYKNIPFALLPNHILILHSLPILWREKKKSTNKKLQNFPSGEGQCNGTDLAWDTNPEARHMEHRKGCDRNMTNLK